VTSRPNDDHTHEDRSAHDQWDELAVGYALTALEPDEMERFIEHLVSFCSQCQQSVDDTASVGAGLASALPVPIAPPSDGLRDSVLRAAFAARPAVLQTTADFERAAPATDGPRRPDIVADRAPVGPSTSVAPSASDAPPASDSRAARGSGAHRVIDLSERRARRLPRSAGWLVAAAAAVVAVVMSVTAVASMHSRSRTAADAANYLRAVQTAVSTSGQVVPLKDTSGANIASVVAHSSSVAVVALDMTPNSKSMSYVLWGVNGKTKNPIALGVFDVASDHVQTRQVGTDSRGYSGFSSFAVSREAGHTPPAKPTTIVAAGTK
jgi:Anti-sigma-K factor rskA